MSSAIHEFHYSCTTENATIVELRKDIDGPPTVCKNDSAHTIDSSTIRINETWGEAEVVKRDPEIGGAGTKIVGVPMQFEANRHTRKEYVLPENCHIFGAHTQWDGCKFEDFAWLSMLHPLGSVDLQSDAAQGATEINAYVDYGNQVTSNMAFDMTGFDGKKYVEFWNSDYSNLIEMREVASVNTVTNKVVLVDGLENAHAITNNIRIKCNVGRFNFDPSNEGVQLFKEGNMTVVDAERPSKLIAAGTILCIVAKSVNAAGTRTLITNLYLKEEMS